MNLDDLLNTPASISKLPYPIQEGGMVYARGYEAARKACLESYSYTEAIQCQPLIAGPGHIANKAEQVLYREGYNELLKQALKLFEKRHKQLSEFCNE